MHGAESFLADLEFNIVSAFGAVRHAVPLMARGQCGSIVCISSEAEACHANAVLLRHGEGGARGLRQLGGAGVIGVLDASASTLRISHGGPAARERAGRALRPTRPLNCPAAFPGPARPGSVTRLVPSARSIQPEDQAERYTEHQRTARLGQRERDNFHRHEVGARRDPVRHTAGHHRDLASARAGPHV